MELAKAFNFYVYLHDTFIIFTFRALQGVILAKNLRLVGDRTAVPYSMSSSVCLLFFNC